MEVSLGIVCNKWVARIGLSSNTKVFWLHTGGGSRCLTQRDRADSIPTEIFILCLVSSAWSEKVWGYPL